MQQKKGITGFRFSILAFLLVVSMLLLAACGSGSNGSNSSNGSNGSSSSSTSSASVSSATPTQNANHVSLAKLVGAPTAKITSGTNFEVTGQVQNLDKSQHDIYLQATLKNASGKVVGIARGLADNVAAGNMDTYTLQGTLMQPAWSTVVVVITKVSENVNGHGSD
jgi:ABC-type glycerol-3-phosphate transport system substrate-binding protein